jgi:hypothetical protein
MSSAGRAHHTGAFACQCRYTCSVAGACLPLAHSSAGRSIRLTARKPVTGQRWPGAAVRDCRLSGSSRNWSSLSTRRLGRIPGRRSCDFSKSCCRVSSGCDWDEAGPPPASVSAETSSGARSASTVTNSRNNPALVIAPSLLRTHTPKGRTGLPRHRRRQKVKKLQCRTQDIRYGQLRRKSKIERSGTADTAMPCARAHDLRVFP